MYINKVQSAQTRALRQITWTGKTKKHNRTHRQALYNKWGWANTKQLIQRANVQLVRKAAINTSSERINQMFKIQNTPNMRPGQQHKIKTNNTNHRKQHNILDAGRNSYNSLPLPIRDTTTKNHQFKKQTKTHISQLFLLPEH